MRPTDTNAEVKMLIGAPPAAVFDAWVRPEVMEQWLFKSPTNELHASSDPRVGGSFSVQEREGDKTVEHYGKYAVFNRPHELGFSLEVPQH